MGGVGGVRGLAGCVMQARGASKQGSGGEG